MTIKDIIQSIEQLAPLAYQESYDNSGLLVGDKQTKVSKVLIALDCTEEVLDEAIRNRCQLIITHHPILFSGLKSITGKNYVERVIIKAIQKKIAIYAAHTNLDNAYQGVNHKIAQKLGLQSTKILVPAKNTLQKLYVYVPNTHVETVQQALFDAGAGHVGNYDECSFLQEGIGTFKPLVDANPFAGAFGTRAKEAETKVEVLVPKHLQGSILEAMRSSHPYEEIAYGFIALENTNAYIGAGMIGDLPNPMQEKQFLELVKKNMKTKCIRHSKLLDKEIQKVAVCGGSGAFLLPYAIQQQADVYVTADFKYHQFFDAENKLVIADIGHYESEQFTSEIFYELLSKKFPNIAFLLTSVNTNPVQYY
jgi:dinuclear metal center YbgI/SA1388 family protein